MALDKKKGITLWDNAISKEMRSVQVDFDIRKNGDTPPPGHQFIKCHMLLDVKMEDLQTKSRIVAGGHITDVPPTITYTSADSRDTARTALTMAALENINLKTADIMDTYTKAPQREKVYTIFGPQFGPDEGRIDIIIISVYRLKS